MFYRTLAFISLLLAAMCITPAAWAQNEEGKQAKQFISDLGNNVVDIFAKQNDPRVREKSLTSLFDKSIDAEWMGKFVMGKNWKKATPAEQEKFLKLYKEFLLVNYLPHFRNYNGEKQNVTGLLDEGDGDYLVRTQIIRPTRETPVHVDYRVHRTGSGSPFYIFDIVTEGVSVVTTHRSDFNSVIAREGIKGLLHRIEVKVRAIKSSSPMVR